MCKVGETEDLPFFKGNHSFTDNDGEDNNVSHVRIVSPSNFEPDEKIPLEVERS